MTWPQLYIHFCYESFVTELTQLVFTCSKPTIEIPEKFVKFVQSSGVSTVDFKQVNSGWEDYDDNILTFQGKKWNILDILQKVPWFAPIRKESC